MKKRIIISLGIVLIVILTINSLDIKTFFNNKYEVKRNIDNTGYTSSYIIFDENLNLENINKKYKIDY